MGIFKSHEERFKIKCNDVPGPTHYNSLKTIQTFSKPHQKCSKNALL